MMIQSVGLLSVGGLILGATGIPANAQAYPAKAVRIVLPFTAGGGVDTVIRILAQKVADSTRQNFVVDNRPGASGNIAFELVAKSEPNGYTLLASTPSIVINPMIYPRVGYTLEDFAPVTLLGKAPLLMVVHPSLPVKSVADLVRLAKAKPGAIRFSSGGTGSSNHLAVEMLRMMTQIDLVHIPYKGGPQALHDVITGQVELTTLSFAETLPQVRAGRVRALAQTGDQRSPAALDIPTMQEAGIRGYSASTWYILFGPARTSREIVLRLQGEFAKAVKLPEVQGRLRDVGVAQILGSTPEEASEFLKDEAIRWGDVVRASGTKVN